MIIKLYKYWPKLIQNLFKNLKERDRLGNLVVEWIILKWILTKNGCENVRCISLDQENDRRLGLISTAIKIQIPCWVRNLWSAKRLPASLKGPYSMKI
jgi:hypothetical protein